VPCAGRVTVNESTKCGCRGSSNTSLAVPGGAAACGRRVQPTGTSTANPELRTSRNPEPPDLAPPPETVTATATTPASTASPASGPGHRLRVVWPDPQSMHLRLAGWISTPQLVHGRVSTRPNPRPIRREPVSFPVARRLWGARTRKSPTACERHPVPAHL